MLLDDEDPMAIGVDRARQAEPVGRLSERREVPDGVLGRPERAAGHRAGGVVDAGHERRERELRSEPAMAAAVGLEELALARHPLAPAAVPWRAASPGRTNGRLGQDPPERARGDGKALALGQQLGQVRVVDPDVRRRRELDELCSVGKARCWARASGGIGLSFGSMARRLTNSLAA